MANPEFLFQGKPCIHGHSGLRWKTSNRCVECGRIRDRELRNSAHPVERHGFTPTGAHHPLYTVWAAMIQRCTNPNNPAYPRYGGRGITVCEQWLNSFATYLADIQRLGERPSPKHTLDRTNNDLGYFPENMAWATHRHQALNRQKGWAQNSKVAKLTLEQVRLIRQLFIKGHGGFCPKKGNSEELAARFGVHPSTIRHIAQGLYWKE